MCCQQFDENTKTNNTFISAALSDFTGQFLALGPKHWFRLKCKSGEKQSFVLKCCSLFSQIAGYFFLLFHFFTGAGVKSVFVGVHFQL